MNDHFIAVDLGASAGRVLLGQWGEDRCSLHELHRFPNRPVILADHLHWDILNLWAEVKAGLIRYVAEFDQPLAGIGIDTWGVDFGLVDAQGHLIGNPYHYRDSRVDGMLKRADGIVTARRIFYETGVQLMEQNTLYQLLSMVENDDPHLAIAETLLMMPDLFHYWLSGVKACEQTDASTSQMLSYHGRSWATEMLAELGLPVQILPTLVPPGTILGEMLPSLQREIGLHNAAPIIAPATHDTASAVAAVPDLDSHSAYISSGTWSLVGVELSHPLINDRAFQLSFGNEHGANGTIRFLKNVTGLWLLQENQRQWQREGLECDWEKLLAMAQEAPPFRCLLDPDHAAFRCPLNMPAAIREYCRDTNQPVPQSIGEIVRCCLDSLALRYRQVIELLEELTGREIKVIRVIGGGSRNRLLCQLTADVCRRPVVAGPAEATALGNLVVQAIAAGKVADLASARQVIGASVRRDCYEPGPDTGFDEHFQRFCALRPKDAP
mgnify:CR=1 FL=1